MSLSTALRSTCLRLSQKGFGLSLSSGVHSFPAIPKRPLTPYFRFMRDNRAEIEREAGRGVPATKWAALGKTRLG